MSSEQHIYAQPPWKRIFNFVVCGLIMAGAAWVNVSTQIHLAQRLPDWSGWAWIIPVACWLYAVQTTVNWATAAPDSAEKDEHLKSVKIAVGLTEAMNLGEHIWAYVLEHDGKFGWDLLPLLALGSLPALMDFLSIHTTAKVLSSQAKVSEPETLAELSEEPELSETPTAPKVPIEIIEPNLPPTPEETEEKVPAPFVPQPRPELSVDVPADSLSPRRKAIMEDRKWLKAQLAAGVKPETMTAQWCADNNPGRRDPRSWLMHKNHVLKEISANPAPADNLVALTEETA